MRNVLERLGDPETIAAEAHEPIDIKTSRTGRLTTALLWIGAVVGVFDLLVVSTSQVEPIEFAFLAVPVVALVVLVLGFRHHVKPA